MRVIQSTLHFPLSSVKPLEGLLRYRAFCLEATRQALQRGGVPRLASPVDDGPVEDAFAVDGVAYVRCKRTGGLFLSPVPVDWDALLGEVSRYRASPEAFQAQLARPREETVYLPKVQWIERTLRMQERRTARVLEVVTPPSGFTSFLRGTPVIGDVEVVDERELGASAPQSEAGVDAAVLLESLDRARDPRGLLRAVHARLAPGGLLFVTALVASGFDMLILGHRNLYLYPPDRANCFTLVGIQRLVVAAGFTLVEVSTPGVLDVEIVHAHMRHDPAIPLGPLERALLASDHQTQVALQRFLQEHRLSSFARIVGEKRA